jgi:hypothetical protein
MKNLLFFGLLLFCIEATCQDYLVKKDGTTIRGKMKTFANNVFTIETEDGKQSSFEATEISKAYMADEHFRMDNISLENATFITNGGLTILLDNSRPYPSASSRHRDYGAARGSGRSESFSSSSIEHISNATSDDDKGTLVINCASCAKKGRFEFVSRDGKSSSKISFEADENSDSFFPYRLKLDADRMYDWTYSDKNIGEKSGSIKLDAGAMMKFSLDK